MGKEIADLAYHQ
uniref:Uncharacterized protein n=1 Tax=Rhizophora mucronata TaxID=61149 RepID=A0A2P2QJQ5_RHIMU